MSLWPTTECNIPMTLSVHEFPWDNMAGFGSAVGILYHTKHSGCETVAVIWLGESIHRHKKDKQMGLFQNQICSFIIQLVWDKLPPTTEEL